MKTSLLVLVVVAGLSCGEQQAPFIAEGGLNRDELTYLAGDTPWPQRSIPVCWNQPSRNLQDDVDRATVQREVENAWEQETGVKFSGWANCPLVSPGVVRIVVNDNAWPLTDGVNVVLPFNPRMTDPNFPTTYWCNSTREDCLISNAIHEFGHILRYGHEQARSGTPETCDQGQWGGESPISGYFGDDFQMPFDQLSVMYYCSTSRRQLSSVDIAGTTHDYGHIRSISAVAMTAGREDVFYRGPSNELRHFWRDGTDTGVESLGGIITSAPVAISPAEGQLAVFALGGYGHMFSRSYAPSGGWSDWTLIGTSNDVFEGDPDASVNLNGSITVVARKRRTSSGPVTIAAWNSAVDRWIPLPDVGAGLRMAPTGRPSLTPTTNGTLVVFRTFSGALLATEFFSSSWRNTYPSFEGGNARLLLQPEQSVRGSPSSVRVASDGSSSIVFRNGEDGVTHVRLLNGVVISTHNLGGVIRASPTATTFDSGASVDVFVRGQADAVFHQYLINESGYLSGWYSLGGLMGGGPSSMSSSFQRLAVYARSDNGTLMVNRLEISDWSGFSEIAGANLR